LPIEGSGELYGKGSWWSKAKACDIFVLLDNVLFSDNYYTHRAKLAMNHDHWLTIPCKHPRLGKLIKDVEIDWKNYRPHLHLKALKPGKKTKYAFRERIAPYVAALQYGMVAKAMQEAKRGSHGDVVYVGTPQYRYLTDWNTLLILKMAIEMGVKCEFRRASQFETYQTGSDQTHITSILRKLDADTYLTGPSWADYAPNLEEVLNEHGIKLEEVK